MNRKNINAKLTIGQVFCMAVILLLPVYHSNASVNVISIAILLLLTYIFVSIFILTGFIKEKNLVHFGFSSIIFSTTLLMVAIVFLIIGYETKGIIICIMLIGGFFLTIVLLLVIFIKKGYTEANKNKTSFGTAGFSTLGYIFASIFLRDISQNTALLIIVFSSYLASLLTLIGIKNFIEAYDRTKGIVRSK